MEAIKTIKFRNTSSHTLRIDPPFSCTVEPGGQIDVLEDHARPGRLENGGRYPSVIEQLAPQMKPVDKEFAKAWEKTPEPELRVRGRKAQVSVQGLMSAGVPRGIAEAILAATKAQAAAEPEDEPRAKGEK